MQFRLYTANVDEDQDEAWAVYDQAGGLIDTGPLIDEFPLEDPPYTIPYHLYVLPEYGQDVWKLTWYSGAADSQYMQIEDISYSSSAVPEPSLSLLLGICLVGLVGAGAVRNIRKRKVANC